jgi:hypothetical protein
MEAMEPRRPYTKGFYSFTDKRGELCYLCTARNPTEALEKMEKYMNDVRRGVIPAQTWDLQDRIPGETHEEHRARVEGLFDVVGNGANREMNRRMLKQASKYLKKLNGAKNL